MDTHGKLHTVYVFVKISKMSQNVIKCPRMHVTVEPGLIGI